MSRGRIQQRGAGSFRFAVDLLHCRAGGQQRIFFAGLSRIATRVPPTKAISNYSIVTAKNATSLEKDARIRHQEARLAFDLQQRIQ
jgi:hypothetical protein